MVGDFSGTWTEDVLEGAPYYEVSVRYTINRSLQAIDGNYCIHRRRERGSSLVRMSAYLPILMLEMWGRRYAKPFMAHAVTISLTIS